MRAGLSRWFVTSILSASFASGAGCVGDIRTVAGEEQIPPMSALSITVPGAGSSDLVVLEPRGSSSSSERLACRVPEASGYPYLLEDPEAAEAVAGLGRVCLDERGEAEAFCRWTERFDVRQRAVASCRQSAVARLHELGNARLGRQSWARVARELPAEWRLAPTEGAPVLLGTWVTMMLTGERGDAADAAPFCLPADAQQEPQQQLRRALRALRWGWETLAREQHEGLEMLRTGIAVTLEAQRIELAVDVAEEPQPPPERGAGCVFRVRRE